MNQKKSSKTEIAVIHLSTEKVHPQTSSRPQWIMFGYCPQNSSKCVALNLKTWPSITKKLKCIQTTTFVVIFFEPHVTLKRKLMQFWSRFWCIKEIWTKHDSMLCILMIYLCWELQILVKSNTIFNRIKLLIGWSSKFHKNKGHS